MILNWLPIRTLKNYLAECTRLSPHPESQKAMSCFRQPSFSMTTAWRYVALSFSAVNRLTYLTVVSRRCISKHLSLGFPPFHSMLSETWFPFMVSWNRKPFKCDKSLLLTKDKNINHEACRRCSCLSKRIGLSFALHPWLSAYRDGRTAVWLLEFGRCSRGVLEVILFLNHYGLTYYRN